MPFTPHKIQKKIAEMIIIPYFLPVVYVAMKGKCQNTGCVSAVTLFTADIYDEG